MSYWIEYQTACFKLDGELLGMDEARFVVACEGGSNNLTERGPYGRERRVREWYVAMLGTRIQVLRQAVKTAAACEGCGLRAGGRTVSPEEYIGKIRRQLRAPRYDFERHVTLSARVPEHHALIEIAAAADYVVYPETSFRETEVKLIPRVQNPATWAGYFRMLDDYLDDGSIRPGQLGQVWHLPQS